MLALFCVAIPRRVYESVGPLDERFGIGMFEDDDYCRRVRAKGLGVRCARDAFVHHWQMASFRKMPREQYLALFTANKAKFEEKWGEAPSGKPHTTSDPARARLEELLPRFTASEGDRGLFAVDRLGDPSLSAATPPGTSAGAARLRRGLRLSNADDRVDGFREVEPNLFLFKGEASILHEIPSPLLWAFPYNVHLADAYPQGARTVYDWIDDLDVFPYERQLLEDNHSRALREATLVLSVARRLHQQALAVRPDALYVPNGVELERFPPPRRRPWTRPCTGF